ncbi:hypothetical protein M9H77_01097 [Catharanthus roseus]|uniref:Uncharacterized protein n=1 Tax=Catharanthus roseus TaxID=4058 RepID=A0ACC0C4Q8_CATRO|nr:hypothetical protein M9H77_01097 [Catharanthus roseus]
MAERKKRRSSFFSCLSSAFLLSAAFFIGSAFVVTDYKEKLLGWQMFDVIKDVKFKNPCENKCRPIGTENLPRGIISTTTNFETRQLWGPSNKRKLKASMNLLAMAVGTKQKENVNKIVKKFLRNEFVIMLFHYDGIVDSWKDFEWSNYAIHVSAVNQTKWWFAKRFLHPDIVAEYAYIFLWDEDLGVENFHVGRYLAIVKQEGLHISQPAIDPHKSEIHHRITRKEMNSTLHRRTINLRGPGRKCDENSTEPPCTGWVEMMAPVFSHASWRCAWHMIQNDLIHAWGLDFQLGYCAQGNRTANIGIVDSEYLVHYGLPTLGGSAVNKTNLETTITSENKVPPSNSSFDLRDAVRKRSYVELEMFKNRWKKAVREDKCWNNPF